MPIDISGWKHIFKIDPDRYLSDEHLDLLCESGTDAVMVGGSSGVTFDNTVDLLSRVRRYEVPCLLEISESDAIVPGFDAYFVPVVLNTEDGQWITGQQQQAVREFGATMDWDLIVPEAYVILNKYSTAAKVTGATEVRDEKDLIAYAKLADRLFRLPILYLEYSGTFGNMELVRKASAVLQQARLFYGGGIDGPDRAREAAEAAHTVIVGNVIYDDIEKALSTVRAVKG